MIIERDLTQAIKKAKATTTITTGQVQPLEYDLSSISMPGCGYAVSLTDLETARSRLPSSTSPWSDLDWNLYSSED